MYLILFFKIDLIQDTEKGLSFFRVDALLIIFYIVVSGIQKSDRQTLKINKLGQF